MSKSQRASSLKTIERPMLILEKQLVDTLELASHVQQARMRSKDGTPQKIRSLFDGMADELQTFCRMLRKRLESLKIDTSETLETTRRPHRLLFAVDSVGVRDQLEALLCAYARYARQTSEAVSSLHRQHDAESLSILKLIFDAVDRCLWFLEIYLEGQALNTDTRLLPDWRSVTPFAPPPTN
jgi:DNA-binding ferritin-like protein